VRWVERRRIKKTLATYGSAFESRKDSIWRLPDGRQRQGGRR
jgi:hypothetical protein